MSLAQRLFPEHWGPWASVLQQGRDHVLRSQAILISMHIAQSGREEMYVFLLLLMRRHLSHDTCIQSRNKHFEWQYFFFLKLEHASLLVILYHPSQNSLRSCLDKAIRTMGAPIFSKRNRYLCYFNCSEHWVYMTQTNICEGCPNANSENTLIRQTHFRVHRHLKICIKLYLLLSM